MTCNTNSSKFTCVYSGICIDLSKWLILEACLRSIGPWSRGWCQLLYKYYGLFDDFLLKSNFKIRVGWTWVLLNVGGVVVRLLRGSVRLGQITTHNQWNAHMLELSSPYGVLYLRWYLWTMKQWHVIYLNHKTMSWNVFWTAKNCCWTCDNI
jgi:hypothetical protein